VAKTRLSNFEREVEREIAKEYREDKKAARDAIKAQCNTLLEQFERLEFPERGVLLALAQALLDSIEARAMGEEIQSQFFQRDEHRRRVAQQKAFEADPSSDRLPF
jgi:hypothetical protein